MPATANQLATVPLAWQGLTWGLVAGFARWLLQRGCAIGTVNGRVYVVKTYARLAMQAGCLDRAEWTAIAAAKGYAQAEGRRIDAQGPRTRMGHKKAEPSSSSAGSPTRPREDATRSCCAC